MSIENQEKVGFKSIVIEKTYWLQIQTKVDPQHGTNTKGLPCKELRCATQLQGLSSDALAHLKVPLRGILNAKVPRKRGKHPKL